MQEFVIVIDEKYGRIWSFSEEYSEYFYKRKKAYRILCYMLKSKREIIQNHILFREGWELSDNEEIVQNYHSAVQKQFELTITPTLFGDTAIRKQYIDSASHGYFLTKETKTAIRIK